MSHNPRKPAFRVRALSLYGLDYLDAVILAALADEQPLLLIGAHGTAKSPQPGQRQESTLPGIVTNNLARLERRPKAQVPDVWAPIAHYDIGLPQCRTEPPATSSGYLLRAQRTPTVTWFSLTLILPARLNALTRCARNGSNGLT